MRNDNFTTPSSKVFPSLPHFFFSSSRPTDSVMPRRRVPAPAGPSDTSQRRSLPCRSQQRDGVQSESRSDLCTVRSLTSKWKQQFLSGLSIWHVCLYLCLPICMGPHSVADVLISGPLNISKSKNTHNEFLIRWTPIEEDVGEHFPICFAVESVGWVYVAAGRNSNNQRTTQVIRTKVRGLFFENSLRSVIYLLPWSWRCWSVHCSWPAEDRSVFWLSIVTYSMFKHGCFFPFLFLCRNTSWSNKQ